MLTIAGLALLFFGSRTEPKTKAPLTIEEIQQFHISVSLGDMQTARSLLDEYPALVNAQNIDGSRPLDRAVEKIRVEMVSMLLSAGAEVNNPGLLYRAVLSNDPNIVMLLLEHGVDPDTAEAITPLVMAIQMGNTQNVKLLLEHDASPHTADARLVPLIIAAQDGRAEIVRLLLEHGADRDAKDITGKTAREYAIKKGFADITELLKTAAVSQ